MSWCKPRKTETSPGGAKSHQKREQRVTIDLSQKNLEALQCFMPKKSIGKDSKRLPRGKPPSTTGLRSESSTKQVANQGKETEQPAIVPDLERTGGRAQ